MNRRVPVAVMGGRDAGVLWRGRWIVAITVLVALLASACSSGTTDSGEDTSAEPSSEYPLDDDLRMNQVQAIGTHNSYHPAPVAEGLPPELTELSDVVDYRHEPLETQLDQLGVRQVELDVWSDPEGGRYVERPLLAPTGAPATATEPDWTEPGLKVFHIAQVDADTSCVLFVDCLGQLKDWSDANPGHMPIMVFVEIKDVDFFDTATNPPLEPWGPAEYDGLDAEIRSVLPDDQIITPDDVQGDAPTLESAVREEGWPTLGESRGKFFFVSCNCLAEDRHRIDYVRSDGSLRDRVLFPTSRPGNPDAAVVLADDPVAGEAEIMDLVASGYMIRSRSDANTVEARVSDTRRREVAFASGAQYVSTDYPAPDPVISAEYSAQLPDGTPARCNPLNAPQNCTSHDIENPAVLQVR